MPFSIKTAVNWWPTSNEVVFESDLLNHGQEKEGAVTYKDYLHL